MGVIGVNLQEFFDSAEKNRDEYKKTFAEYKLKCYNLARRCRRQPGKHAFVKINDVDVCRYCGFALKGFDLSDGVIKNEVLAMEGELTQEQEEIRKVAHQLYGPQWEELEKLKKKYVESHECVIQIRKLCDAYMNIHTGGPQNEGDCEIYD